MRKQRKQEIKYILKNIGAELSALLPEGIGFIFMRYESKSSDDGDTTDVVYVSNTDHNHNSVVKLMTEFCEKTNTEGGDDLS